MSALTTTGDSWSKFLEEIGDGVDLVEAMRSCKMTRKDLDRVVSSNPLEADRWNSAQSRALRSRWSTLDLNEIFSRMARGVAVKEAVIQVRGQDDSGELFLLLDAFPDINEQFMRAKRAQARAMVEGLDAIASDSSKDILENGKGGFAGNMAAVGRSKLRVESGQWIVAAHLPEVYGDRKGKVDVTVNINPAERLEESRARVKAYREGESAKKISKAELRTAIDATFTEQPVAREAVVPARSPEELHAKAADLDMSWLDSKTEKIEKAEEKDAAPLDAVWREES